MNWVSIGSDNALSSDRHQANIWTNAGILLIAPLGTNLIEIGFRTEIYLFLKINWKMSSAKRRPFCPRRDELILLQNGWPYMGSEITSLTTVYTTIYPGADQRKHQSSESLAFVRGIHRSLVNSSHKGLVTRIMFPFDEVFMITTFIVSLWKNAWQNPWWRHQMETFSALLAFCAGNSPVTGDFPAQRPVTQWTLMFPLICAWTNIWANNGNGGDLRCHRTHYISLG